MFVSPGLCKRAWTLLHHLCRWHGNCYNPVVFPASFAWRSLFKEEQKAKRIRPVMRIK
jgi:hypothetical protein